MGGKLETYYEYCPNGPPKKLAYTSEEAGYLLGVSARTIQRLCKTGVLPTLPGIRVIRVPATALVEYIAQTLKGLDRLLSSLRKVC